ncbi:MAG: enoyl-CoA hydratase-related protein [Phycisphaerae bacterium]
MSEQEPMVLVKDDGAVRTLTLSRPDVLNAFNTDLLKALGKAVKNAAKDATVRCLVITGAGRAFCSGQDLAEVADKYTGDEPIELGDHLCNLYNPMIKTMRTMEKPVIAGVNGVAAGAGASLALACDLRIASDGASFMQAFVHVGVVPDSGSTFMLPRLVGFSRALELAITGRKVKADEALRIGLINQIVEADDFADRLREFASTLAHMPTKAIGLTKRAINAAWNNDLARQLDYEAMLQTTAGQSHDHREGVVAFLEKRKPNFTGE